MTTFKSATFAIFSATAFTAFVVTSPMTAQDRGLDMGGPCVNGRMPAQIRGGTMGIMGREGMMGMAGMQDHLEARIAFIETELKITDTQMPQWTAFADTLRANARRLGEMRSSMMERGTGASMSAPDRLVRTEKMMTAMIEALKATTSDLAPLYAELTDDQKKIADQLIYGPMGM
jgi:hypothetical protein